MNSSSTSFCQFFTNVLETYQFVLGNRQNEVGQLYLKIYQIYWQNLLEIFLSYFRIWVPYYGQKRDENILLHLQIPFGEIFFKFPSLARSPRDWMFNSQIPLAIEWSLIVQFSNSPVSEDFFEDCINKLMSIFDNF